MKSTNHLIGGIDKEYLAYSFVGLPLKRKHVHSAQGKSIETELYTYAYDHVGRPLTTTHQLNTNRPVVLVNNKYDAIGRLASNSRNGQVNLKTDYTYNVRSWTKSISSPLFAQTLYYNDGVGMPCYNGNISSMTWKTSTDVQSRGYKFNYDGLSRMKDAVYGEGFWLADNANRFNERVTDYDKMGNIQGLLRYGQTSSNNYGLTDNLSLTYNGNQLKSVYDNVTLPVYGNGMEFKDGSNQAVEYEYDKNGNLTKDLNKNIVDIQYNLLNLPRRIEFANSNHISYLHDANGKKLRTTHIIGNDTRPTDYCGNLIYENGVAKTLLVEGGYVSLADRKYHFYLQDHQGNNRVVASENGNIDEVNHYYPFGGTFASSSSSVQPYKYNGKELDRKEGLDWYDYGARHYDAAIGRFATVDPMVDSYYQLSPYGYCGGNPICHRDEEGKFINNIIGAVIGGAADFGVQVAANLVTSKGAFENINWVSVGTSTIEGALTSGLSVGKTLAVKVTASIVRNTTSAMMGGELNDANDVLNIATESAKDVVTSKIIGKAGDVLGKGVKSAVPQLNEITQKSNRVISNNKATQLAQKLPGVSDTKTARKLATSKNGIVDASKTINKKVQKVPENAAKLGLEVTRKIYLDDKERK